MKSDLISRSELFNRLAGKQTKAEFYAVINDMPTTSDAEKICRLLDRWFDAPCAYGFGGKDVTDVMPPEWCEKHCSDSIVGDWKCWRKLFEVWEE